MFEDGHIPPSWNSAAVVAVPKKGNTSDKDNYRGIVLINCFIKILTRIISTRIMSPLESTNTRLAVSSAEVKYPTLKTWIAKLARARKTKTPGSQEVGSLKIRQSRKA
ncbi:hypothetical protein SeLEV6574_g08609 [Synchytrium endobioticum]|uniref:Reverse transcriptase domain-containing protein n=1 Tax=Synchytrium endobioticum TaxID=286115 RepID=A0A507BS04_9FUNG|nr:hypothetical protein SeLEV6574_g08609 [Synchytrium endobioticum]